MNWNMKKKLILLVAALLAAFIPAMALNLQRGVTVSDTFLPRRSDALYEKNADYRVALTRGENETRCDVHLGEETLCASIAWQGENVRVEYDDGALIEGVWFSDDTGLTSRDGMPIGWMDGLTIVVNDETARIGRGALANALCHMDRNVTQPRGSAAVPLLGVLFYALGAASLLWPEQVFFFGSRWRYSVAELSEEGIAVQKAAGIVMLIASVFVMFLPLLS